MLVSLWNTILTSIQQSKQYFLIVSSSLVFTVTILMSAFSIVDAVFLNSVPYAKPAQLVWLENTLSSKGKEFVGTNTRLLLHAEQQLEEDIATYFSWSDYRLIQGSQRQDVSVLFASANLFDVLEILPIDGRLFGKQERQGNKQPSAILSYGAWQTLFNGDNNLVGQSIQLNKRVFNVVGILPNGVTLPGRDDTNQAIWLPLDMDEVLDPMEFGGFGGAIKGIARIKGEEETAFESFSHRFNTATQEGAKLHTPRVAKEYDINGKVTPLSDAILGESKNVILALVVGALLIAGIATINIASMHLARAVQRTQIIAVSLAFGATQKQVFKESFQRNLLLTLVSVVCGLMITQAGFNAIFNLAGGVIPRLDGLSLTLNLIVFACILAILLALLLSWVELKTVKEQQLLQQLQSSGKGQGKQVRQSVIHTLIGLQLGFSLLVLTASAHLFTTTLEEFLRSSQIAVENRYNFVLNLAEIKEKEERKNLHRSVMQALQAIPSVEAVSSANEKRVPAASNIDQLYDNNGRVLGSARYSWVDDRHLAMFDMAVTGKKFSIDDYDNPNNPIIINQRLADTLSGSPIGSIVTRRDKKPLTIVGVVSNTDYPGAKYREGGEVFLLSRYSGARTSALTLKHSNSWSEQAWQEKVLSITATIDPRLDIQQHQSVSADFDSIVQSYQFGAIFSFVLAVMSLVMVVAGITGMVNYATQLHRYSLGVKMAMGAKRKMLLQEEVLSLEKPIVASAFFVFSLTVFIVGYLRTQPNSFIELQWEVVATVFPGIVLLATLSCWLPIRRVLSHDPIKALRNE